MNQVKMALRRDPSRQREAMEETDAMRRQRGKARGLQARRDKERLLPDPLPDATLGRRAGKHWR